MRYSLTALILLIFLAGCGAEPSPEASVKSGSGTDPAAVTPVVQEETSVSEEETDPPAVRPAALPEAEGIELTQELLDNALIREGNTSRLRKLFERAEAGEKLTLAYLGGSITGGSGADPMESACYAALTTQWWRDSFPQAEFEYINAGIGETDSWVGVHRVEEEVLRYKPDLVVVEFSVNDSRQELNTESYDSLLMRILSCESEPAVIPLMLASKGHSFAYDHAPVIMHYDLPMIAYFNLLDTGFLPWEAVGNDDGIHPKNAGHALIADLLCAYYSSVLEKSGSGEAEAYTLPEAGYGKCRYTDASFVYSDTGMQTEGEGFVPMEESFVLHHPGWETESAGSFSFECSARTLGIAYRWYMNPPEGGSAVYDVYVDDVAVATIDPSEGKGWADHLQYVEILKEDTAAPHRVRLVPAQDSSGKCFQILALALGE
ncbi:MAG: hypothetical protein IK115_04270 [Lachnospiraceae bacterium]|nr:hypothetical protein [Lachnospiraceae bacterium]